MMGNDQNFRPIISYQTEKKELIALSAKAKWKKQQFQGGAPISVHPANRRNNEIVHRLLRVEL